MAELTNLSFCETSRAIKCFKISAVGFSCFSNSSTDVSASLWRSWEKLGTCEMFWNMSSATTLTTSRLLKQHPIKLRPQFQDRFFPPKMSHAKKTFRCFVSKTIGHCENKRQLINRWQVKALNSWDKWVGASHICSLKSPRLSLNWEIGYLSTRRPRKCEKGSYITTCQAPSWLGLCMSKLAPKWRNCFTRGRTQSSGRSWALRSCQSAYCSNVSHWRLARRTS